jgi:kynurenine formamidase
MADLTRRAFFMHHTHKLLLALIAAVLVLTAVLLWNRTSHAPEPGSAPMIDPGKPEPAKTDLTKLDETKVIDLTYAFDEKTIYWTTAKPFEWQKESWGQSAGGYWYTAARYAASEHGGTHLDSPIHFGQGKAAMDEIPLSHLISPAMVIDISAACAKDADYRLTLADVTAWETQHGSIPDGSLVLVHTGWGKFWPDKKSTWERMFPAIPPICISRAFRAKQQNFSRDSANLTASALIQPAWITARQKISSRIRCSMAQTFTDWKTSPTWSACPRKAQP